MSNPTNDTVLSVLTNVRRPLLSITAMMIDSCAFIVRSFNVQPCFDNVDNPKSVRFGITQVEADDPRKKTNATDEQVIALLFGEENTNEVKILDLEVIAVRRGSKFFSPVPGRNVPHCQIIFFVSKNLPMSRWTCKQLIGFF
jgi:hypothetical protein